MSDRHPIEDHFTATTLDEIARVITELAFGTSQAS